MRSPFGLNSGNDSPSLVVVSCVVLYLLALVSDGFSGSSCSSRNSSSCPVRSETNTILVESGLQFGWLSAPAWSVRRVPLPPSGSFTKNSCPWTTTTACRSSAEMA